MLSVDEAFAAILNTVQTFPPRQQPLLYSMNLRLAEDCVSDIDSPPFDKSAMDGYAVRTSDCHQPEVLLNCLEEVHAGQVATMKVEAGETIAIMTGAPIPSGADAVIPVEQSKQEGTTQQVRLQTDNIKPNWNILRRGMAMQKGDVILKAGHYLRAQELGALAELGKAEVRVVPAPRIAVLATGDELVEVAEKPGPGQIRNSNETMLAAQVQRAGGEAVCLGIARDEPDQLKSLIARGLQCDILLLSGGVSAGKRDLVPAALAELGIEQVFHKVHLKPGKPIWFGKGERADESGQHRQVYVFGLPGNPVGSMVGFELFVRSAIRKLVGFDNPLPQILQAELAADWQTRGDRPTYHPSQLTWVDNRHLVQPAAWKGSADLQATANANAMVLFPEGEATYSARDKVSVIRWQSAVTEIESMC